MNKLEELAVKTQVEEVIPIIFWKDGRVTVDEEDLKFLKENIWKIFKLLES